MVYGHVQVRDGLRLNSLSSIHHKQRSFAGSNASRNLIREVNMPRSVDQVQYIPTLLHPLVATGIVIFHLNSMTLDGNASFFLQIHIIQHLSLCNLDRLGIFQQAVGQGRFTMVNMRDDTEIPYMLHQLFCLNSSTKVQKYLQRFSLSLEKSVGKSFSMTTDYFFKEFVVYSEYSYYFCIRIKSSNQPSSVRGRSNLLNQK